MPLMGCRRSLSCLYSWNAWAIPRTCASRRWGRWIATTAAPTTRGGSPGASTGTIPWTRSPLEISRRVESSRPASAIRTCSEFTTVSSDGTRTGSFTCTISWPPWP